MPVIIHLLNRRRDTVIDWGAMQFLDLGRRARRKIRLTELLLMLARMGLLALGGAGAGPAVLEPRRGTASGEPATGRDARPRRATSCS